MTFVLGFKYFGTKRRKYGLKAHVVEKRICSAYKGLMARAGDRLNDSAETDKLAGAEVFSHERIG
jgi:hypothetical protein